MLFETLLLFGAEMYNDLMQVIFIITGLVSIKSLTDMVTELVGQGNALKDGEETGKEVKKRAFQTAGLGIAGLGVAKMGVGMAKAGAGVAKNVGSTLWNSRTMTNARGAVREKAGNAKEKVVDWAGDTRAGKWYQKKKEAYNDNEEFYNQLRENGNSFSDGWGAQGWGRAGGMHYAWRRLRDAPRDAGRKAKSVAGELSDELGMPQKIAIAKSTASAVKHWGSAGIGNIKSNLAVSGDVDNFKGAWAGYKGVAKDFNKQLMKMTGGMDITKDFADESGQDDLVEKYTKALYGYKTEKTKAGEAAQGQADATISTLLRKTAGVGKAKYEDINEFNSVPIHTQDVNVQGATINLNANQANQNAGTVNQNAATANNNSSSSTPQQVSLAEKSLQVALDSNSLSAMRDAENQTSANISARLNALAMGMSLLGQNVRDLETPLKEISKNTANIATNTKGRKKNN